VEVCDPTVGIDSFPSNIKSFPLKQNFPYSCFLIDASPQPILIGYIERVQPVLLNSNPYPNRSERLKGRDRNGYRYLEILMSLPVSLLLSSSSRCNKPPPACWSTAAGPAQVSTSVFLDTSSFHQNHCRAQIDRCDLFASVSGTHRSAHGASMVPVIVLLI
jgi:hypothetical protein